MSDDAHLLRQYIEDRSDDAFAELVQRHLGLVYGSAMRQLGDAHLAQDVAQSVFVLLARKSRSLLAHSSLAGWLHTTTHFKVSELRRAERRRRIREDAAHELHVLMQDDVSSAHWERLRPMIDEALLGLKEGDREAVLLRFFEERPFSEIAEHLRLTEKTAHKRVERALERLRERLARRGVTSTAAALAAALGSHALAAPPVGLAATVTGSVASSAVPAAAAWSISAFMGTKTAMTAAAAVLVMAGGIATQQVVGGRAAAEALSALERENATLAARVVEARDTRRDAEPLPDGSAQATAASEAAAVAQRLGSGGLASIEEGRAFLRANPEVREALEEYFRITLAAQYSDLIVELGLTPAEREQFLTILASGSGTIMGEHWLILSEPDVSGAEIGRRLRELLGEARYQQYRDFRRAALQRNLVQEMTRSLYFTPTPLTPAQAAGLKETVARLVADESIGPKYTGSVSGYIPMPVWDRMLMEAPRFLDEPQLEALRELRQGSQFFHVRSEARKAYRAAQASSSEGEC